MKYLDWHVKLKGQNEPITKIKNDTEKDLMNTFVKCKLVEVCNDYDFIATLIEK